jgi:hypothetical protein
MASTVVVQVELYNGSQYSGDMTIDDAMNLVVKWSNAKFNPNEMVTLIRTWPDGEKMNSYCWGQDIRGIRYTTDPGKG